MSLVFSFVYSNIRISSLTNSKIILLKIQSSDTPVQCDVWSFLHKWNPTDEIHSFCTKPLCFHLISTLCSKRKMQYNKWLKVMALKEKVKFSREVWVPLLGEVNYGKSACYLLFGENAVLEERLEGADNVWSKYCVPSSHWVSPFVWGPRCIVECALHTPECGLWLFTCGFLGIITAEARQLCWNWFTVVCVFQLNPEQQAAGQQKPAAPIPQAWSRSPTAFSGSWAAVRLCADWPGPASSVSRLLLAAPRGFP